MNHTIYGFLAKNYGLVERGHDIDIELEDTYKNFSKQQLKKELSRLKKFESDNVNKVKFVARLLRKMLAGNLNSTSKVTAIGHNAEITKNFWKYVKNYVEGEKSDNQKPSFGKKKCVDYFKSAFKSLSPRRLFVIPSWMPRFTEHEHSFDTSIPTYAEITRIIRKIKSRGSPCPLKGEVPKTWKKAVTVSIYKSGETDIPSNFRPITLETVPLKIFTSILRNRMYRFVNKNNYIENSIQKGFVPGMTGTFEHTVHLAQMIKQAKLKQRSIVVTLLDLKTLSVRFTITSFQLF